MPTVIRGKAYGGYARLATLVKGIRAREKNVVLLNAGDTSKARSTSTFTRASPTRRS